MNVTRQVTEIVSRETQLIDTINQAQSLGATMAVLAWDVQQALAGVSASAHDIDTKPLEAA
jgi:hypothetical protein